MTIGDLEPLRIRRSSALPVVMLRRNGLNGSTSMSRTPIPDRDDAAVDVHQIALKIRRQIPLKVTGYAFRVEDLPSNNSEDHRPTHLRALYGTWRTHISGP